MINELEHSEQKMPTRTSKTDKYYFSVLGVIALVCWELK